MSRRRRRRIGRMLSTARTTRQKLGREVRWVIRDLRDWCDELHNRVRPRHEAPGGE